MFFFQTYPSIYSNCQNGWKKLVKWMKTFIFTMLYVINVYNAIHIIEFKRAVYLNDHDWVFFEIFHLIDYWRKKKHVRNSAFDLGISIKPQVFVVKFGDVIFRHNKNKFKHRVVVNQNSRIRWNLDSKKTNPRPNFKKAKMVFLKYKKAILVIIL